MRLNTKLVMMMLTLLVISMMILFVLNQHSQNDLVKEIQESSTEVSKAIQISVEDLTSESEGGASRLRDYLQEARTKGINEISIISNEGEIIDSSDPAMVGKKREIRKMDKGLKVSKGSRGASGTLRPYELLVPVIVGDEQLGYVQIHLLLDNIRDIQHANFLNRILATALVFMVGIALIIFLARRYTMPIHRLVAGVQKVAAGDLSVTLPVESTDELGELAENFNEMVTKLKERDSLEKRLYEAEHLSKVGQLASGIAHEIRNPLNYISLAIDHLREEMFPECDAKRDELLAVTEKIKEEVRRANYMVVNFMNYGRPLKLRPVQLSYAELLDRVLPVIREKLDDRRISLAVQVPADLPPMRADQELLRNCIFNFITNAAEAMPEGGTITLGASYDTDAGTFLLTFADQGTGIAAEDLEKIFQPYFTTKEAGIGLGLAITERIVKEHGGTIRVANDACGGTVFTVTIPASRKGETA